MSGASQIGVRGIVEAEVGVTPDVGDMQVMPFTTYKVSSSMAREDPGDVRADRQVDDYSVTESTTSGSAAADYRFDLHRPLMDASFSAQPGAAFEKVSNGVVAVAAGNKLVSPDGWVGLGADPGFLWVEGFAGNGDLFMVRHRGLDGNELSLDPQIKTLVDEAAGPEVRVWRTRDRRLGETLTTLSLEQWNRGGNNTGWLHRGVVPTQWKLTVPHPNKCNQAWTLTGLRQEQRLAAPLALGSQAIVRRPNIRSNMDFLAKSLPDSGLSVLFGSLLTAVRIKQLVLTVDNPHTAEGGAGPDSRDFEPTDLCPDGRFGVRVELDLYNNGGPDTALMLDAARDPDFEEPFGFGFHDRDGNGQYFYCPMTQAGEGEGSSGVAASGREMSKVVLRSVDTAEGHSMLHHTEWAAPSA